MFKGMAFTRQHGFQVQIRNANAVADRDMSPEQTFGAQNLEFPISLLGDLKDDQAYRAVGVIAPVFDMRGQIAFVMGLTGFTQSLAGDKLRHASLRLRQDYLAITTFGIAVTVQLIALNFEPLTGGAFGLGSIPRPLAGAFATPFGFNLFYLGVSIVEIGRAHV